MEAPQLLAFLDLAPVPLTANVVSLAAPANIAVTTYRLHGDIDPKITLHASASRPTAGTSPGRCPGSPCSVCRCQSRARRFPPPVSDLFMCRLAFVLLSLLGLGVH
jgi:hypothetical protein